MSLDNIRIVLVRPQGAANIGAAARALKNMGLRQLVLVQARQKRSFLARAMAVHARDVLDGLQTTESLSEAVADCGLVVGTTCRDGPYRAGAEPPRNVAPRLVAAAASNRVAVVFGPEDHGLSNEDLKLCHQLIVIPTAAAYPSLNLSQAVMVCCYELQLAQQAAALDAAAVAAPLATAERVDFMLRRLQAAFSSIGFLHADNPDHIMYAFRRILGRVQLDERDVRILLGLARQIEWFGKGGWETMRARQSAVTTDDGEAVAV